MAPTLVTSCTALPPEGALRLRTGEARSAALAGEAGEPILVTSRTALTSEQALRLRAGGLRSAALAENYSFNVTTSLTLQIDPT